MPDARENDNATAAERDEALADGALVPEEVDAQPGEADVSVVEAKAVPDAAVSVDEAGSEEDVEVVEAELVEAKRPSVNGHLAKPKKKKAKEPKARKPINAKRVRHVICGIIAAVLVAALVAVGLFCWQKWMHFDDAADIQGVWKVQSTGDTIVFDKRNLKLTRGISYEYRLDANEKTITYAFGDLSGGGHYYFSGDRQTLIIIDGDERLGTLAEVGFLPEDLVNNDDATDNKTVLAKVSDDTTAEPSGTATGVTAGMAPGEREYVLKPEPSSSSSSSKKKSSSSSDDDEDLDEENRGFVDRDGDGYDDETDLDYESFMEEYGQDDDGSDELEDEDQDSEDDEEDWEDEEGLDDEGYEGGDDGEDE
ncbi:MAG: hypothetical protein Q4D27_05245 [Coriobacteriia bacterium]|nr:hypothetical protein [Coriobacteriia bacterium]